MTSEPSGASWCQQLPSPVMSIKSLINKYSLTRGLCQPEYIDANQAIERPLSRTLCVGAGLILPCSMQAVQV